MTDDRTAYVERAFKRLCEQAVASAQEGCARGLADGAKRGFGGNTLSSSTKEYERAFGETTDNMVRLAFDAMENTSDEVCALVERGLRTLRDALADDLAAFFRSHCAWAGEGLIETQGNEFMFAADWRISSAVDDLRHGLLGSTRLAKDLPPSARG